MKVFTIGFTQKNARKFFSLLRDNNVKTVVDIRLNNTSQLAAFAKGEDLKFFLTEFCNIDYIHDTTFAPTEVLLKDYKNSCIFLNNFDHVDIECINNLNCSLQFVKVENFTITPYIDMKGNQKLQATFNYNGRKYNNIRVTDSVFSAYPSCYGHAQKVCSQQNAYIMVSLPYDDWSIDFGKFYKYVSGIILI